MGSFIYNGFASNLPIRYGEEAVMFIGVENLEYRPDVCYIGVCGKRIYPIALPIFGKMGDYGVIEEPVKDYNYNWLSDIVGNDLLKELDEVRDCLGDTFKETQENIKKYEEEIQRYAEANSNYDCAFQKNSIKTANRYLELYKKLMGKPCVYNQLSDAIVYMVERRDVYDMFIEADGKQPYMYGFHEKKEAQEIESLLRDTLYVMDKYHQISPYNHDTPFSFDCNDSSYRLDMRFIEKNADTQEQKDAIDAYLNDEKVKAFMNCRAPLSYNAITFNERMNMMHTYLYRPKDKWFDWNQVFKETCDWIHFNRTLADVYGVYDKSIYGGQWANYKKIIAMHSSFAKLMRESKKDLND